jgi:hypothetical protein
MNSVKEPRWLRAALILTLACLAVGSANASLVTMTGTLTVTSSSYPEMLTNDLFHFVLTYDDSVTDANAGTTSGTFSNALTAFSLTRDASNVGSWNPSGGTFSLPAEIATVSTSTSMIFTVDGSGFPTLDGNTLDKFQVFIPLLALSDTGSGQTLAQQLGATPTFNPLGSQGTFLEAGSGNANFDVIAFGLPGVPEPAAWTLTTLGGALLFLAKRRPRK